MHKKVFLFLFEENLKLESPQLGILVKRSLACLPAFFPSPPTTSIFRPEKFSPPSPSFLPIVIPPPVFFYLDFFLFVVGHRTLRPHLYGRRDQSPLTIQVVAQETEEQKRSLSSWLGGNKRNSLLPFDTCIFAGSKITGSREREREPPKNFVEFIRRPSGHLQNGKEKRRKEEGGFIWQPVINV